MAAISFIAKVLIKDETTLETMGRYDMGTMPTKSSWKWRKWAIDAADIYSITDYGDGLILLTLNDDESVLAKEKFEDAFRRWNDAKFDVEEEEVEDMEENEEEEED